MTNYWILIVLLSSFGVWFWLKLIQHPWNHGFGHKKLENRSRKAQNTKSSGVNFSVLGGTFDVPGWSEFFSFVFKCMQTLSSQCLYLFTPKIHVFFNNAMVAKKYSPYQRDSTRLSIQRKKVPLIDTLNWKVRVLQPF